MVDECTEETNHVQVRNTVCNVQSSVVIMNNVFLSQVVVILRWVDGELSVQAQEELIGLYMVPSTETSAVVFTIHDALAYMNLSPNKGILSVL